MMLPCSLRWYMMHSHHRTCTQSHSHCTVISKKKRVNKIKCWIAQFQLRIIIISSRLQLGFSNLLECFAMGQNPENELKLYTASSLTTQAYNCFLVTTCIVSTAFIASGAMFFCDQLQFPNGRYLL